MSAPARIAAFAALLAVVFATAAFAGSRFDVDVERDAGESHRDNAGEHADEGDAHPSGGDGEQAERAAAESASESDLLGLASAAEGYRLVLDATVIPRGPRRDLSFRILDRAGQPVRDFDLVHERRMHLILVRRDFHSYQHLHPRLRPDGRWVVKVDASEPGPYRAFADFSVAGVATTLSTDFFVPGRFEPQPRRDAGDVSGAGEGYEVAIDARHSSSGQASIAFSVRREGDEVEALEPYLGADGHLVALREGDLAYLHTHPEDRPEEAVGVASFTVEYPSPGRYRVYFQFKHRGEVRTAAFTQEISGDGA